MDQESENTEVIEENDESESASESDEMSLEELKEAFARTKDALSKANREAAGRRILTKEQEAMLKAAEEAKEAAKSETQKLLERIAALEKDAAETEREKLCKKAARAAELGVEWAERLRGDSYEELLEDAKSLKKKVGKGASNVTQTAGSRGKPVGNKAAEDPNAWFTGLISSR